MKIDYKFYLAVLFTSLIAANAQINQLFPYTFEQFKNDFAKAYQDPADEQLHRLAFEKNLQEALSSGSPFSPNKFLDLTEQERNSKDSSI